MWWLTESRINGPNMNTARKEEVFKQSTILDYDPDWRGKYMMVEHKFDFVSKTSRHKELHANCTLP